MRNLMNEVEKKKNQNVAKYIALYRRYRHRHSYFKVKGCEMNLEATNSCID